MKLLFEQDIHTEYLRKAPFTTIEINMKSIVSVKIIINRSRWSSKSSKLYHIFAEPILFLKFIGVWEEYNFVNYPPQHMNSTSQYYKMLGKQPKLNMLQNIYNGTNSVFLDNSGVINKPANKRKFPTIVTPGTG